MSNPEKEALLKQTIAFLHQAQKCETIIKFRRYYATPKQFLEEEPMYKQKALGSWLEAKRMMCENKQVFDELIKNDIVFKESDVNSYLAAQKVIEKEISSYVETTMLGEQDGKN